MPKFQRCLVIPAAIVAMIAMSSTVAAQCDTSPGASVPSVSSYGAVANCGGGCSSNSRWPGDCAGGNCGGGAASGVGHTGSLFGLREGFEKYKADFALNHARNTAWPKPFNCWDRQALNDVFNISYSHGLQTAHMLTSEHFNPETNKLNRAGENVVAWIMQRAAQRDKKIFLYEDKTGPTMDQRLASVSGFTERYYKHMGQVQIAKSMVRPNRVPADYQAQTMESYFQETPSQRIPVQAGATIQSSVGN